MLRRILARLLAPLNRWVLSKIRSEHQIRGFRVVLDNSRPDIDSEVVLRRFTDALDVLAQYQPVRFAHMRRDVRLFWIVRQPVRGAYYQGCDMIMTELTFLARTDIGPEMVAANIAHEAMHARIDHMRLRPESRDRAREERICHSAALALGRALPVDQGSPVVAYAEAALRLSDDEIAPVIDWKEATRRQLAVDRDAFRAWRRGAA